jgi:hypothetical protein
MVASPNIAFMYPILVVVFVATSPTFKTLTKIMASTLKLKLVDVILILEITYHW